MTKPGVFLLVVLLALPDYAATQTPADRARLMALETQLQAAEESLATLTTTIDMIVVEVAALKGLPETETTEPISVEDSYIERVLVTDLGHDERAAELTPRPELFVQTRYHANPIDEATEDDIVRNLGLNRVELRWAGRVSDRIGVGYEIQYHPAPDGASEELVNDAYVEYYPSDSMTVRA